jgi:phage FluMu protein Com
MKQRKTFQPSVHGNYEYNSNGVVRCGACNKFISPQYFYKNSGAGQRAYVDLPCPHCKVIMVTKENNR